MWNVMVFYHLKKIVLDTRLGYLKTAFKQVVHEGDEILVNETAGTATKSTDDKTMKFDENPENVKEIIIPQEKREKILNELRKVL